MHNIENAVSKFTDPVILYISIFVGRHIPECF